MHQPGLPYGGDGLFFGEKRRALMKPQRIHAAADGAGSHDQHIHAVGRLQIAEFLNDGFHDMAVESALAA